MTTSNRAWLALATALTLTLYGCGGGGGGDGTTDVPVTVVDGAIRNATVCLDKNRNGNCDADEPFGKTDANGKVTLKVSRADAGRYPILAVVGTDAVDADSGPVPVAFTLKAPADKSAVVSPLTTLVQTSIEATGQSSSEAEALVRAQTGVNISLFEDFTQSSTADHRAAGTLARLVVITTQQQTTALVSTVGTDALDGSKITRANLDRAIQKRVLERMPDLLTALTNPTVLAAATPAAKEAALLTQANALVADGGLTAASLPTVVAIDNQIAAPAPVVAEVPSAGFTLAGINFTDSANYFVRYFTATAAQNTLDANNNFRYVDRRVRSSAGNVAKWGFGGDPWRQADLHWNGSAWVNCPINFASISSARDAKGDSTYNYCDNRETGKSNTARFDVSGRTMASVYTQIRDAGFTNFTLASPPVLGSATFPSGSFLRYSIGNSLTAAISYYPGRSDLPGVSNAVSQYSPAVSAGGIASNQGAGVLCNSAEFNTNGTDTSTLEAMIAAAPGTPCVYSQASFVYQSVTYLSDVPNEAWGGTSLSLGIIGNVPLNTGVAPGFYTGNIKLRVAFKGTGTNPVTYYTCKERFTNGSTRNCVEIGTGSYTITTLGDARVMTFNNLPAQASALTFTRVFVERGGAIYYGYQNRPTAFSSARLTTVAGTALLAQLGLTPEDPSLPLALTAGSYQGTWDARNVLGLAVDGTTVFIGGNGNVSCQDPATLAGFACSLTITNPATGAFSFTNLVDGATATGTLDFHTGIGSGTFNDPTSNPTTGNLVVRRR